MTFDEDDDMPIEITADDVAKDPVIIIEYKNARYGAGSIINNKVFERIADGWDSNIYILPTSVDALFTVPEFAINGIADNEITKELKNMVMMGNEMLFTDEKLSNSVYIFNKNTKTMAIIR